MTREKKGRIPSVKVKNSSSHANPIDVYVGRRIRQRRMFLGISQEKLGEALGLTFQQVQKYEKAINRVGASRLFDLSRVLGVGISFFFEDAEHEAFDISSLSTEQQSGIWVVHEEKKSFSRKGAVNTLVEDKHAFDTLFFSSKETIDLLKAYYKIEDQNIRKKILELVKTLSIK
ncbi:helix-turn-helix domain-containing protein [Entomobacter blattae]|uniref:Helix-turn-helix protein n=1 Tax=Entomobacter blattae TaxID=2762277 RepID=A0A7H1NPH4_9PROT|nr:helix-turn-helix transcriptional regulator [Entomobacter blattae]QNT77684.1 helix-turn-helix protein [Entomobacter blattae]